MISYFWGLGLGYPNALRTLVLGLLGPNTILHKFFGPFWALGLRLGLQSQGCLVLKRSA